MRNSMGWTTAAQWARPAAARPRREGSGTGTEMGVARSSRSPAPPLLRASDPLNEPATASSSLSSSARSLPISAPPLVLAPVSYLGRLGALMSRLVRVCIALLAINVKTRLIPTPQPNAPLAAIASPPPAAESSGFSFEVARRDISSLPERTRTFLHNLDAQTAMPISLSITMLALERHAYDAWVAPFRRRSSSVKVEGGGGGEGQRASTTPTHTTPKLASAQKEKAGAKGGAKGAAKVKGGQNARAPAGGDCWVPSEQQLEVRKELIRRLVWLDTEGQLQIFARSLQRSWESGDAANSFGEGIAEHVQQMQKRSPLLAWHLKHNVAGSITPLMGSAGGANSPADAKQRAEELQQALSQLRRPFVALVGQASRARPEASAAIGASFAQASALLLTYGSAVRLRLPQRRRYELMNVALAQVVKTVSECRKALGDEGESKQRLKK